MTQLHPYPAPKFTGEMYQSSDAFNSKSGDLQFPGTLEETTGAETHVTEGYADKKPGKRLASPATQLFVAPHPHTPQTFSEQAATLHFRGPTSRDLGIPRRCGPAGNAGQLSPFQVTIPRSPAQDLTPAASPPVPELSPGCRAEKVQPSAAFSLCSFGQITRLLWLSLFVQPEQQC